MKYYILVLSTLLLYLPCAAFAPTNFFAPFDINWRTDVWPQTNVRPQEKDTYTKFKLGAFAEYGDTQHGHNSDNDRTGVLSIYQDTQSSIAMLLGAPEGSPITTLARTLSAALLPATDDGCRGRFELDGNYREFDYTFFGQYTFLIPNLPGNFDLTALVPFKERSINNIEWCDLTQDVLSADLLVKELITDNLDDVVCELGGLKIRDFTNEGIADVVFMFRWWNDFIQIRKRLKKVRLTARVGVTIPTAGKRDPDEIFSLPLGYDGAIGIPGTLGLDLYFINHIKLGAEFQAFKLLNHTRVMRLKTAREQTDFLLLNKGSVRKKVGVQWKFNLYAQAERFFHGLSAMVAYQYIKQDDSKLHPKSHKFVSNIINTAESLKDWTTQNIIFQANYDFFEDYKDFFIKPQLSFFAKFSLDGRRVIDPDTIGGQLAFNF